MHDVIIIGKGPAGISASLYTARANLSTVIIGRESYLKKAKKIDNYYGFPGGIDGTELLNKGEEQAKSLGVNLLEDNVVSLQSDGEKFKVITESNEYESKTVLIATGLPYNKVKIENLEKYEGKGIHYCVTCDGFFYNNLKVGIIGYTDYAVHECMDMLDFTKNITLYTNGNALEVSKLGKEKLNNNNIEINTTKIVRFEGTEMLESIIFENGEEKLDGVFIAYGTASSSDFARKMGIVMDKDAIKVNEHQMTNTPGIFAAGDCTGNIKQVSVAVGQGAIAGKNIIEYLKKTEK